MVQRAKNPKKSWNKNWNHSFVGIIIIIIINTHAQSLSSVLHLST